MTGADYRRFVPKFLIELAPPVITAAVFVSDAGMANELFGSPQPASKPKLVLVPEIKKLGKTKKHEKIEKVKKKRS